MESFELTLAEDTPGLGAAGQKVTLALTPADVHSPEEMSTYLAGYHALGFRADEASKVIPVDKDEDKFRSFDSDDAFKRVWVKGSGQGPIPEVDPKTSLTNYKVTENFIGSFIPAQVESNATGAYQPRMAAARRCKRALQLEREHDVWGLLGIAGSWNAGNVLALTGTRNWNGGATADPMADVMTMLEGSAAMITDLWMNYKMANLFMRTASVRDHMRQMLGDGAAGNALVGLNGAVARGAAYDFVIPGLPPIHVVAAKSKNAAGAIGYVLGDVIIGTVSPPGIPTDGEEIASSYTFRRKGPAGVGFNTREFRVEGRGPLGGTMVVASMAEAIVMTGTITGGLITGAYV